MTFLILAFVAGIVLFYIGFGAMALWDHFFWDRHAGR